MYNQNLRYNLREEKSDEFGNNYFRRNYNSVIDSIYSSITSGVSLARGILNGGYLKDIPLPYKLEYKKIEPDRDELIERFS